MPRFPRRLPRTPYAVRLANPGKHLYPPPLSPLSAAGLRELLAERSLASPRAQLYVHLPFCETICTFCPIHKLQLSPTSPVEGYLADLAAELHALSTLPLVAQLRFDSVYFGGGTPSVIPDQGLARLIEVITSRFTLDAAAQMTFEGHVSSLTRTKVRFARGLGFNRLSTGVQTFDPALRRRLNLTPTHDDIRRCLDEARAEGFADFNVDLMYNLPGQTAAIWERDLLAAAALAPSGIDVYDTVLAHTTPLHAQLRRGELALELDPRRLAANYRLAEEVLAAHGFRQRNLYAWDGDGFENRLLGRQGELRDRTLHILGAGLTAYSLVDGTPFINEAHLHAYRRLVAETGHGVKWVHRCTEREEMERFMILSLEDFELDRKRFGAVFGRDMDELFAPQLASFRQRGLIVPSAAGYVLTAAGRAWATTMTIELFGAPVLAEILRARLAKSYFGGMTREEELELPLFAAFHPRQLPGLWRDLPLLRDYLRLLRRTNRRWLARFTSLLLRTSWRHGAPAWRWYVARLAGLLWRRLVRPLPRRSLPGSMDPVAAGVDPVPAGGARPAR